MNSEIWGDVLEMPALRLYPRHHEFRNLGVILEIPVLIDLLNSEIGATSH